MNDAQFKISINNSIELLTTFGLFKASGKKGIGNYSVNSKKIGKTNSINQIHSLAIENLDYEILLQDQSIFQFSNLNGEFRYAYIQNPHSFYTKEEYLNFIFTPDDLLAMDNEELNSLIDDIDENQYEQFLNEQELNSQSNYFRYDASSTGYSPLIHSFSHLHIGLNQNVRIPVSLLLTPLKFTKFSIKNTYFDQWKKYALGRVNLDKELGEIKKHCMKLSGTQWNSIEENELYIR